MAKKVDIADIDEVARFVEAAEELRAFKDRHRDIFNEFERYAENYNQKLNAADKAVRAAGVSCGPFDRFQETQKVDDEGLYESLGREKFLTIGTVETLSVPKANKEKLRMAVELGEIPKEIADANTKTIGKYRRIDPVKVPS